MPPAACIFFPTGHPGVITGPGVPTVLINGLPAAVAGDTHVCAFPPPAVHPPTPIPPPPPRPFTVLIGGRPPLRMGDLTGCGAPITYGSPNVMIG